MTRTLDDLVVVTREVGAQLASMGVPVDLEAADAVGEPPRAPRWAKIVWDALKLKWALQGKGGVVVTAATSRLFVRLGDQEFRTKVLVVLSCIDNESDRAQAAFEFATEGLSTFCSCGRRLSDLGEVGRMRCDSCNWHDRPYDPF